MDEPFSAVDPVVRERLQSEFLRLQDAVRKTIVLVTHDTEDLEHPPVVHVNDSLADARSVLDRAEARWADVLDNNEHLHGWISHDRAQGAGTVMQNGRRMEAWVPVDASLKSAFSQMLQLDSGWVAILDGGRFLGVLTPESLHSALRRTVDGSVPETAGAV